MRQRMIEYANSLRRKYPQYLNYYDEWIICKAKRTVRYKGGAVLCRGRLVLADPSLSTWFDPDTGNDCAVEIGTLQPTGVELK